MSEEPFCPACGGEMKEYDCEACGNMIDLELLNEDEDE